MPSVQAVASIADASAIIGVLAVFACLALAGDEEKRRFAYAALSVGVVGFLAFAVATWYCGPVETRTEQRLAECCEVVPLGHLGYLDESGFSFAIHTEGGIGGGAYVVVIVTADGGYAKMELPESDTVIYPTSDPTECRVETWMDCEAKIYRDGTVEAEFLSGFSHSPRYKLYIPLDGIDSHLAK